jgi:hypothetical protein
MNRCMVSGILLIVLCAWPCAAKPVFGVKGGLNFANAWIKNGNSFSGYKSKLGLIAGISFTTQPHDSNVVYSRLELLYVQKGWKQHGQYGLVTPNLTGNGTILPRRKSSATVGNVSYVNCYYIDELVIAPFAVVRVHQSRKYSAFFQLGAEFGFNVRHTVETSVNGFNNGSYVLHDWELFNPGINIGAGVTIPTDNGDFVIDSRYNFGLMNLSRNRENRDTWAGSIHTQGIQLLLGYNFKHPIIRPSTS